MSAVVQSGSAPAAARSIPLLAAADLQRTIVFDHARQVSAARFLGEVHALAQRLPAARYAVNLCEDRYQFLLAFCAVVLAGQTNLLPASRAPRAVADVLQNYPASYAIGEAHALDLPGYLRMPGCDELHAAAPAGNPAIAGDHVVAIGFTSGSTGAPKPNAKTWAGVCASSALNAALLGLGASAGEVVATVPPQHMYGLEMSVLLPLRSRAAIHSGQPFFPADVARALADAGAPRLLVTTPFHLRTLLQAHAALPPLQAIVTATAPLDAELARAAEQAFATRVIEVFGSTETCVIAHRRAAEDEPWQPYSGIELQPQPDGTLVHAPHFAAPTLLQDIVELLPGARFRLCGRNSDLLEIAGKRASLADLTRHLLAIDGVLDASVFQLDADARGLRRLAALVVAPERSEAQIRAALREAIDPVFLPRPLRRVPALPRNAAGKLPREALLGVLLGETPVAKADGPERL